VEETGDTFAENAVLKATRQARHLSAWVLAEDSGLSVDALGGRPGVYSARFSGEDATDASNNELLLQELSDVPLARRSARYVCHMVLADPEGAVRLECEATCEGRVLCEPVGSAGFGYDPLFEIVEYHRSFGQLGDSVKSVLSHRGRALRIIIPQLVKLAEADLED
jgi:XTP/dITP diphosphohydrolase